MLCYAHASSLNSWAPDPVDSVVASASSPVTSPPAPPPADSTNSIRSLRGRRLGSPHKSQDQSPWTIMPSAKSRNITSTSATAVIRRKNSRDNNFRPVNATRALTGSKQDPDDALVNGEFVSKKVIGKCCQHSFQTILFSSYPTNFRIFNRRFFFFFDSLFTADQGQSLLIFLFFFLSSFTHTMQSLFHVNQKKLSSSSILQIHSEE